MKILSKYSEQSEKIYDYTLTIEDYYIFEHMKMLPTSCMCVWCAQTYERFFKRNNFPSAFTHQKKRMGNTHIKWLIKCVNNNSPGDKRKKNERMK